MLEPSEEALRGTRIDLWGHTLAWAGFGALFMGAAAIRPCLIVLDVIS